MKILIVSDLHEHKLEDIVPKNILDNIDFIISTGDYENNYPYPKETIGIYGNHDEDPTKSIILCHQKIKEYKGMTFLGIGGVFCGEKCYYSQRKKPHHQLESEIDKFLDKCPHVTFFLSHERAYQIFDDAFGSNAGYKALRKYIDEKEPSFYISGHMKNDKDMMIIGKTICLNPHSSLWDYIILTLPEKKIEFYIKGKDKPLINEKA